MPTIQKTLRMFKFISGYIASNHEAPTLREIGNQFEMRSPAGVFYHVLRMERLGLIRRVPNVSRGIRLIEQEKVKAA